MTVHSAIRFCNRRLIIIDQTRLPDKVYYLRLSNYQQIISAIKHLKIRGAPLIGVAAAYGLALESTRKKPNLRVYLASVANRLKIARPTAVNLQWAVNQMLEIINNRTLSENELKKLLLSQAQTIDKTEQNNSYLIGANGAQLVKKNSTIITICNTGWLAAPGIGTALGIIYTAHNQGKKINVFVLETRPLLQGARLTAYELSQAKIPYTLITDNMVGSVMNKIDMVLVGTDRIVRNGDTANKIGTLTLAITARYYHVPFYVAAPSSSFDLTKKTGQDIIIEQRNGHEVRYIRNQLISPKKSPVYNPAFDVTPHKLITAIITEKGILKPPYPKAISKL
ncbi:MAG: S-methyl-5-thioribose-1-phosphate isomerase [Candidatus Latescibacteria bacterium]|nr:S-methyl-5-thioribose-1-phosphate isomerase [Candidatus Latescibacterota bacterium]